MIRVFVAQSKDWEVGIMQIVFHLDLHTNLSVYSPCTHTCLSAKVFVTLLFGLRGIFSLRVVDCMKDLVLPSDSFNMSWGC
jgi:hypothetical protein